MNSKADIIFNKNTVEFVTVAAEYCAYIEQSGNKKRRNFIDTLLKILPLLYLKATLLPEDESENDEVMEDFVTEDDYEVVRLTLSEIMGDKDDYLDVFVNDMKYSDTPIRKNISEDLADIYQDIKNFIMLFQIGVHHTMHDAVLQCREHFAHYWGQTLVNTLRALHEVYYGIDNNSQEEGEEDF